MPERTSRRGDGSGPIKVALSCRDRPFGTSPGSSDGAGSQSSRRCRSARHADPRSSRRPRMHDPVEYPSLRLGTAPDSWGVWFPDDPRQVSWSRYLDEVREAGYALTELGPFGYLPTEPARLRDELEARGLDLDWRDRLRRPAQGQGRAREGQGGLRRRDGDDRPARSQASRHPARGLYRPRRQPDRIAHADRRRVGRAHGRYVGARQVRRRQARSRSHVPHPRGQPRRALRRRSNASSTGPTR